MSIVADTVLFDQLRNEVINRVMPGLRHKMLGKLQPITLLSHVLSRKVHAGSADAAYVQTQVDEIKLNAKILTNATQNLFTWIAQESPFQLPADELVSECLELLKMECYTNNLIITNHVSTRQMLPAQEARVLLCAGIILMIDKQGTEKKLQIRAEGDSIQFSWNKACAGTDTSNTGLLSNWDWATNISEQCEIVHSDVDAQFNFKTALSEKEDAR
ncbi:MAG: hypothetical protein ACAH08_03615 [Methylophilus sp.]